MRGRRSPLTASRVVAAAIALWLTAFAPAFAQGSHVLVIVGLGGDHENAERFHRWASAIVDAAKDRYGLPPASIVYLGEDPARDTARISGRSTREAIDAAVTRLAAQARPGDRVFIVLIGHGASATGEARFNLPGPDLAAADFARLVARFARAAGGLRQHRQRERRIRGGALGQGPDRHHGDPDRG